MGWLLLVIEGTRVVAGSFSSQQHVIDELAFALWPSED